MIDTAPGNLRTTATSATAAQFSALSQTRRAADGRAFRQRLEESVKELARLQADTNRAINELLRGRRQDALSAIDAMRRCDEAYQSLLAVRGKLLESFDEIRNMPV